MDADPLPPESTKDAPRRSMKRLVRRVAWVCKYCDFVYCDDQVSQCDCLGAVGKKPPHFIKGEIKYSLPNSQAQPQPAAAKGEEPEDPHKYCRGGGGNNFHCGCKYDAQNHESFYP